MRRQLCGLESVRLTRASHPCLLSTTTVAIHVRISFCGGLYEFCTPGYLGLRSSTTTSVYDAIPLLVTNFVTGKTAQAEHASRVFCRGPRHAPRQRQCILRDFSSARCSRGFILAVLNRRSVRCMGRSTAFKHSQVGMPRPYRFYLKIGSVFDDQSLSG